MLIKLAKAAALAIVANAIVFRLAPAVYGVKVTPKDGALPAGGRPLYL